MEFKYSKGCLMLELENETKALNEICKKIVNTDDIYESEIDGEFGFENEFHITVLFGFKPDTDPDKIKEVIAKYSLPIEVTILDTSVFENKEFDVLKFTVDSSTLIDMNKVLSKEFDTEETYEYSPHMTIAYLKKGKGKKYKNLLETSFKLYGKYYKYTAPDVEIFWGEK